MPPIRHRRPTSPRLRGRPGIKLGDVVSFSHHDKPTHGVVTSLVGGEVHVQHLVSTPLGHMRAHKRCSTPPRVTLTTLPAPRFVKEVDCFRDSLPGCDSCHHRDLRRRQRQLTFTENGVEYRGQVYHVGELVFRRSETKGEPWGIGIVKAFRREGVTVQPCGRLRDRGGFEVSFVTRVVQADDRTSSTSHPASRSGHTPKSGGRGPSTSPLTSARAIPASSCSNGRGKTAALCRCSVPADLVLVSSLRRAGQRR